MDSAFDSASYQIKNHVSTFELSPDLLASFVRELTKNEVTTEDVELLAQHTPIAPQKFSSILIVLYDLSRSLRGMSQIQATEFLSKIFPDIPDFSFVKARHASLLESYQRDILSSLANGSNLVETISPRELAEIREKSQTDSLREMTSLYRKVMGIKNQLRIDLILNPPEPLRVVVNKGDASDADLEELMFRLSELYVAFGGSGLNYEPVEVEEFEGAEA